MMAAGLKVTLQDKAALRVLKTIEKNNRAEIVKAYTAIGVHLKGALKKASPRDTGALSNAHGFSVDKGRLHLQIFNRKAHALFVHEGRKPGTMPPSGALQAWARRKLKNPKLAFVVARAIKLRGIKGRPWFTTTIDSNRQLITEFMERALARTAIKFNKGAG